VNRIFELERFYKLGVGLLAWALLIAISFFVGGQFLGIAVLFGFTLLFTYLLVGPVNLMEKVFREGLLYISRRLPSHLPRVMSILIVYLTFALVFIVFALRFVPVAVTQLVGFSQNLPTYTQRVEEWLLNQSFSQGYFHQEIEKLRAQKELTPEQEVALNKESMGKFKRLSPTEKDVIRQRIFSAPAQVDTFFKDYLGNTFNNLLLLVTTTLTGFIYTLTGLVLVFYFLLDGARLKDGLVEMLPQEVRYNANYLLLNMHHVMFGFIKGQVFLGILTGAYMILIYSLFGVPYAIFLGAFFAIAEILPVVGTWLGFLPGILVLLFMNPFKLVMVACFLYMFQLIKDNLIAPKIVGKVMGLHPVIVILSLLICARAAGLVGVLFAIPLASMINVTLKFFQNQEHAAS